MSTSDRFAMNVPRVIGELIDDEAILIDLETGSYFSLVGSGAQVWSGVLQRASLDQIARGLRDGWSDLPPDLDAMLAQFLKELVAAELVVPTDDGPTDDELALSAPTPSAGDDTNDGTPGRPPFAAPTLDRFDDMQDLIMLDPIHDVVETEGWPRAKPVP